MPANLLSRTNHPVCGGLNRLLIHRLIHLPHRDRSRLQAANSLYRERRPQLDQEALLALWLNGVPLRVAWLVFADELNAIRYFELRRVGSHLELERFLKADHLDQLRAGKRQAIAVQESSDAGLVLTRQHYFLKTAEVDWENDKITSAGKTFHGVISPWGRELPDEGQPPKPTQWIHPRELEGQWELRPPSAPEPFPGEQWEWEALEETLPNEPPSSTEPSEFTVQGERELLRDTPRSEPTPPSGEPPTQAEQEAAEETPPSESTPAKFGQAPSPLKVGRPSKVPEIEKAIELLLGRGVDLGRMTRPKAFAAIKECAANELDSNVKIGFHNSVIQVCLFRRFGPRR